MTTPTATQPVARNGSIKYTQALEWVVRVLALLAPVMFGTLLGLAIAGERRLDAHEVNLATISANRFTAQDGADMQRQIGNMVTRQELAVVVDRLMLEFRELRRTIERNGNAK